MYRVFIASTGNSYYIFDDPAPALNTTYTVTSISNPNSTTYSSISNAGVVCFLRGTMIETPEGPLRIETLRPGDRLVFIDGRQGTLRAIGSRRVAPAALRLHAGLRPFRIRAGAFGANLPACDVTLSRQHRVLIRVPAEDPSRFAGQEVMGPVHALAHADAIAPVCPPVGVEYWHLLLDGHEVLPVAGLGLESALVTQGGLVDDTRLEWQGCAPSAISAMTPARPLMKPANLRRLLRRHGLHALAAACPTKRPAPCHCGESRPLRICNPHLCDRSVTVRHARTR
ncbi:Hint domain-containing protein [Roseivivax lentus]|uniref:Hint domain-containing protein n=1 Tax=Roseivivax lentus TaxID=633194 RepID=A0A1N7MXY1_9RHOB|nr:Hint domain-containing protein [Roseivivax lentus]SIS90942.1 Hint domain-containing protein [Roseivivax lentus]